MTTTTSVTQPGLELLVRRFHLHSETSREVVREGERRRTAAVEVRLWATLPRGAAGLPGEPACRDAARAATRVAEAVLARDEAGGAPGEIEPVRLAVYESRQFPGRDALFVAIRLPLRFGEDGLEDRAWEPRLRALRARLDRLGVFEGRWREPPPPGAAEEPWTVRPAAAALAPAAQPSGPAPRRAA